jgi:hypothetical protein
VAVAPDLYLAAISCFCNLPAYRSGGLLFATRPGSLRSEYIVISCNSGFDPMVALIGEVKPLAEQLFPAIFAVRRRRLGTMLGAIWIG